MRLPPSIRSRLFIAILGIFTVSFTVLFVTTLRGLSTGIEQEVASDLEADLKYVHSQFFARPMATRYSLNQAAAAPVVIEAIRTGNLPWLRQSLRRWRGNVPFMDVMVVLDRDHRVVASAGETPAGVVSELASVAERAQQERQAVIAAELVSKDVLAVDGELSWVGPLPSSGHALVMTVAVPVLSPKGQIIGTIIAGDILNRDRQLLYNVPKIFGNEVEISITQGLDRIASSSDDNVSGSIAPEVLRKVSQGQTFIGDTVVGGIPGKLAVEAINDSTGNTVGTLSVALSRERYDQLRYDGLRNVLLAGGFALLLSFALAYPAALALTAPIDRICAAARRVQDGDLDFSLEGTEDNELGRLAQAFNAMTMSLRERDLTIRKKTSELEEVNNLLGQKVTERTAQLSTEMGRLEAILTNMADGVIAVDWTNRVVLFNPAAQRMTGIAPGSVVGRRLGDLGDYVEMQLLMKYIDEVRASDAASGGERLMALRGRSLKLNISRLSQGGRLSDVVISIRDVTADEEMKRIKNDLIIAVSHEFKTPLTSMKGALELLLKKEHLGEQGRDLLEVGLRNTERLHGIVTDLLQLTKVEAGGVPVREPLSIQELIAVAEKEFSPLLPVRVVTTVAPDVPPVYGERDKLLQVIVNVVANAAHMAGRGATVQFDVRREGKFIACSVSGGAPSATTAWPHSLGVAGTTFGSGLGMVFCKEIIEAHNGRITFAGGEWGTEVIFTIPAYEET